MYCGFFKKVNLIDEPIPDINCIEPEPLTYGERCLASGVIQILIAAHIRAFTAGTDVIQAIFQDKNNCPYSLQRTIKKCGLTYTCNMEREKGKSLVANIAGCASPVALLKWILVRAKKGYHKELLEVHDVLDTEKGNVVKVELIDLDVEWDEEISIPVR